MRSGGGRGAFPGLTLLSSRRPVLVRGVVLLAGTIALVAVAVLTLRGDDARSCLPLDADPDAIGQAYLEPCPPTVRLRYNTFDPTGVVAEPGSYAFLISDGDATAAVTTFRQLLAESTVLRVNVADARGDSQAAFYDNVRAGDVVEWRQSDDCWARYLVAAPPIASAGAATREFEVKAYTYATWDWDCSGAVVAAGVLEIVWSPPVLARISTVARHGLYYLVGVSPNASLPPLPAWWPDFVLPDHVAAIRDLPCCDGVHPWWREAEVPEGWTLSRVTWGQETGSAGYTAWYANEHGEAGVRIVVGYWGSRAGTITVMRSDDEGEEAKRLWWLREARIVDGHHAIVSYRPPGWPDARSASARTRHRSDRVAPKRATVRCGHADVLRRRCGGSAPRRQRHA